MRQVAANDAHTGMVTEDGDLFMCGSGYRGRLGLGDMEDRTTPTLVRRALFDNDAVLMVACGGFHTVVATVGGGVYTFGLGEKGQLGHGELSEELAPRRGPVAGPGERVVMVAAGNYFTVALSEAGHVYTCGWNLYGQLGHGDQKRQVAFVQVDPMRFNGEKVEFVAAGSNHTVAITAGGRLYTWGSGLCGKLGHGVFDIDDRLFPTLVKAEVFGGRRVAMAACAANHTLVVTEDGSMWACGHDNEGQLGLNRTFARMAFERLQMGMEEAHRQKFVAVAASTRHSLAVTEQGTVWTWGSGRDGGLGHGNTRECLVPTRLTVSPLDTLRVGRFHLLPQEDAIAFAMSQNRRLGASSRARALNTDMLKMIQDNSHNLHNLDFAKHRSLITLLGGRVLLRPRVCHRCSQ